MVKVKYIDKYYYYNSMANINLSTIRELLNVGYDVSINDNEAVSFSG